MSDISIRARGVGKWYRIDHEAKKVKYLTLRDQVAKAFTAPFSRKRSASKTSTGNNGSSAHDNYVWALKDVSFDIRQGEVVGLIGPNGAGKSTLLKILTRITEPTTGSIDIFGRVGSLLEVGTGFHKELTGRDNVYLNGAVLGMKKAEIDRKFDEIVAFSEVEKFIDTPVKFYSSGMTVRLAFAVAAHLEPEILLVDEVLAVGDASFQKKSLAKMESVGQAGRTVIFVSHHMPSITRLCERAILLNHGQVMMSGPATEVVGDYLSANLGTSSTKEWDNELLMPGNDICKLRSIRVINPNGSTSYTFDIRQPIGVEMTYDVLRPGYALYPHFTVHNEEEVFLFTSIDTDSEWRGQNRQPGRYVSVAWIPGNMLAEGTMSIGAAMRSEKPHMVHFYEQDVVTFQVVDNGENDTSRVDYVGRMRGVMRPYLEWTTSYVPESAVHTPGRSVYGRP